jgi:hypothetical protein
MPLASSASALSKNRQCVQPLTPAHAIAIRPATLEQRRPLTALYRADVKHHPAKANSRPQGLRGRHRADNRISWGWIVPRRSDHPIATDSGDSGSRVLWNEKATGALPMILSAAGVLGSPLVTVAPGEAPTLQNRLAANNWLAISRD